MVVVKVELWPGGDQSKARMLGQVNIANDGTGNAQQGNYDVALSHAGVYYGRAGAWKTGRVVGHTRSLSPYHLVEKAIRAALYGKRG